MSSATLLAQPVAWFSFDDPGNPGLDSTGNHHAIQVENVSQVPGVRSLAGSFSTGWMQLPESTELDLLSGDFTLSVFMRTTDLNTRNFFTKASVTAHVYGFATGIGQSTVHFGFNGGVGGQPGSMSSVVDGEWHHITGVKRGQFAEIWIDGVFEEVSSITTSFVDQGAFAIGRDGQCCEFFNGEMDEAKIWDRALSPLEIAEEAGIGGSSSLAEVILFTSDELGDLDIWMISPDGSSRQPFIVGPGNQTNPRLSPSGRSLAYTDTSSGTARIVVRDLLTGQEQVLTGPSDITNFAWNANETAIISDPGGCSVPGAFSYPTTGGGSLLFTESGRMTVFDVNANTGAVFYTADPCNSPHTQIRVWDPATGVKSTVLAADGRSEASGDLSEDGQWLVYTKSLVAFNRPHRIYLLGTNGTPEVPISSGTGSALDDGEPHFSPDGDTVVFMRHVANDPWELWLVNRDGTNQRPLLQNAFNNTTPSWGRMLLPNQPPIADAGEDELLAVGPDCTAETVLDPSGSSDPDGDELEFLWTDSEGEALIGPTPIVSLSVGVHTFELTVDDGQGGQSTDTVTLTVEDLSPPFVGLVSADPDLLWPPNHRMVPIGLEVEASDNCSIAPTCVIVAVTSNEPIDGPGDGNTEPDWLITGDLSLDLRAERSGQGNGRVYSIEIECADESGNVSESSGEVVVPKSRGRQR